MRVVASSIAWKIRRVTCFAEFEQHLEALVQACPDSGLIVLPEFFSFELLSAYGEGPEAMIKLADDFTKITAVLQRLALLKSATIVGGSHVARVGSSYQNLCPLVTATEVTLQAKVKLTQFEMHEFRLTAGMGLRKPYRDIASLICYDSEFPEAARVLAEAGATTLCVPAFTETIRGFQRVRWSCQARAIENQIFVIHSSLVGSLDREPVPVTYGSSAILAPSVLPFPESAILAETPLNEEGVATAELDFELLAACRQSDDVRNWQDRAPSRWKLLS